MEYRIWRAEGLVRIECGDSAIELSDAAAQALGRELTPPPLPLPPPPHRHNHHWSDQEVADVKASYENGIGVLEIAQRHGVSISAAYKLLIRIGMQPRSQKRSDAAKRRWARKAAAQ